MSNVFKFTDLTYSQLPDYFVDEILPTLTKLVTVKVYLFILRRAQQYSKTVVKVSTSEIKLALGISNDSLTTARAELLKHKLVRSKETINQGLWSYTLLNPRNGEPLPDPRATADFNTLSEEQVKAYYLGHLAKFSPRDDGDSIRATCPFHTHGKQREKPLSITVTDGGVWHCFRCNKSGKLVDFEVEMAARQKQIMTRREAHHSVRVRLARFAEIEAEKNSGPIPTL